MCWCPTCHRPSTSTGTLQSPSASTGLICPRSVTLPKLGIQCRHWDLAMSQFWHWTPSFGTGHPVPVLDNDFVSPWSPFWHYSPFWHWCQNGDTVYVPILALPCVFFTHFTHCTRDGAPSWSMVIENHCNQEPWPIVIMTIITVIVMRHHHNRDALHSRAIVIMIVTVTIVIVLEPHHNQEALHAKTIVIVTITIMITMKHHHNWDPLQSRTKIFPHHCQLIPL